MPKIKSNNIETMDDLVEEIQTAEAVVKDEMKSIKEEQKTEPNNNEDSNKRRNELLKLAEDEHIDKSVAYIKKASQKVIDKLYFEYERKRMRKANGFLTDLIISKFSSTLGGLDAINSVENLEDELKKDDLLQRDVDNLVSSLTP